MQMKLFNRCHVTMTTIILSAGLLLSGCSIFTPETSFDRGEKSYTAKNYGKSFKEIKQAATGGDPDAAYALGYMYYYGKGTHQDVDMGKAWIHRAADQGQPMAIRALQLLDQADRSKMPEMPAFSPEGLPIETNALDLGYGQGGAQQPAEIKPTAPKRTLNYEAKERGLLSKSSNSYTLELMSSDKEDDVINFLDKHKELNKGQVYWYRDKNKNKYVVTYGAYSSDNDAMNAAESLPRDVRDLKPWAKPISSIKSGIRASAKKTLPAQDVAKSTDQAGNAVSVKADSAKADSKKDTATASAPAPVATGGAAD